MQTFRYTRLHIPTGNVSEGKQEFMGRREFMQELNKWNASRSPDVHTWKYWADESGTGFCEAREALRVHCGIRVS